LEEGRYRRNTKLYNEVFSTLAVMRRVGADDVMRVKVSKLADGANLPGFTYTQESADF
jgi:hypothetical protein